MTSPIDQALARETIAGIVAAPGPVSARALTQLEPGDFPNWVHATIFTALQGVDFTGHPEPGSIMVQLHRQLLQTGKLADHDNGLRAELLVLAQTRGHPEQLPHLARDLLDARFRRQVTGLASTLADRARDHPLQDVDETLRLGVEELRRLRKRIPSHPALRPITEEGAA